MSFSLAELKRDARRALHQTLAVDATYRDSTMSAPVSIRVRWHDKIVRTGDLQGDGYAEMIAAIDRLVFDRDELAAGDIVLIRGGRVVIADYGGATFILDSREPADGPQTLIWNVTRDRGPA